MDGIHADCVLARTGAFTIGFNLVGVKGCPWDSRGFSPCCYTYTCNLLLNVGEVSPPKV